jgi:predicted transcriptional regulator
VEEDTQEDIASDLGVAQQTVSNGVQELQQRGKLTKHSKLTTDDKRDLVRDYCDDNPDASNREVSH